MGLCVLSLGDEGETGARAIFSVWVDPADRRQGALRTLVDAAARLALLDGAHHLVLWVKPDNVAAVASYEHLGFTSVRVEPEGDENEGELLMDRPITTRRRPA
jgi:ribosomal protein S18 acetylase RimI-like enzyme